MRRKRVGRVSGAKFLWLCLRQGTKDTVEIAGRFQGNRHIQRSAKAYHSPVGGKGMKLSWLTTASYLPGWKAYFRLAQTRERFKNLTHGIRHRLSGAIQSSTGRSGKTVYSRLRALGASHERATPCGCLPAQGSCYGNSVVQPDPVLPFKYFDILGFPRLT